MQNVILTNGISIPTIGFGVFQIPKEDTKKAVLEAIKCGYRHIDTAAIYGNETEVGEAIRESGIEREELFITTKLWLSDASYEGVKKQFHNSLVRLGLDYVDLYLIHQPIGDVFGAWKAIEELYQQGKIKAIGVSNFSTERLMDFISFTSIKPMINQIEIHPFNQKDEEIDFMKANNIVPESWGTLAEGKNDIFQNKILMQIAQKYHKSVAQIILKYFIEKGVVVLVKSVKPERIAENIDIFDFELSSEDKEQIATLQNEKFVIFDHKNPAMIEYLLSSKNLDL